MNHHVLVAITLTFATGLVAASPATILQGYRQAGAGPFNAVAGEASWKRGHRPQGVKEARSCASCHGTDITRPGSHVRTGKTIDPLAVSVNATRLTDAAEVEKWFGRNCRWTLGRECTPQEKGDFLQFINTR